MAVLELMEQNLGFVTSKNSMRFEENEPLPCPLDASCAFYMVIEKFCLQLRCTEAGCYQGLFLSLPAEV